MFFTMKRNIKRRLEFRLSDIDPVSKAIADSGCQFANVLKGAGCKLNCCDPPKVQRSD
jgi:hypothetical protein